MFGSFMTIIIIFYLFFKYARKQTIQLITPQDPFSPAIWWISTAVYEGCFTLQAQAQKSDG